VVPAIMLTGAPTVTAWAKEPAALTAGPAGVLASAAMKGGPVEGWGHEAAAVPAGAPMAAAAPMARSREAAATA
jgi:hypothetical protein